MVFLGALPGIVRSPLHTYAPLVGAQLDLPAQTHVVLEVDPTFEHGLLIDDGELTVGDRPLRARELRYLAAGRHTLDVHSGGEPTRLLVLGGVPLEEQIVMWWNFVGRSHDEIAELRRLWEAGDERFGVVPGYVGVRGPGDVDVPQDAEPVAPGARTRRPTSGAPSASRSRRPRSSASQYPRNASASSPDRLTCTLLPSVRRAHLPGGVAGVEVEAGGGLQGRVHDAVLIHPRIPEGHRLDGAAKHGGVEGHRLRAVAVEGDVGVELLAMASPLNILRMSFTCVPVDVCDPASHNRQPSQAPRRGGEQRA
jgi:hypothetical protein